jgi:hypothetical protein
MNTLEISFFKADSQANEANQRIMNKELILSHLKEKETFQDQIVIFI